eukprot:TRINITY_DN6117_c0_g1_i2.p1 TRINITY_DN6117_c0_g1~~TRINITY_DN6117_c0_g1_i2.p1  ORF type:complete len:385 (-),score=120.97 TRINITY_DN6117_c0_g1_i2:85-1239(-)
MRAAFRRLGFVAGGALFAWQGYRTFSSYRAAHAELLSTSDPFAKVAPPAAISNVCDLIGNTPLIELKTLSAATGCRIYAKAEHLNPGMSVKDRAALRMVQQAEREGTLKPGGVVIEGTGGNTGVGLALVAAARGYGCRLTMPDYVTPEKQQAMKVFGAEVILLPPAPFSTPRHFYHAARALAESTPNGCWMNQFENDANWQAHYYGTAPEIWKQTEGKVDGFVCSMGTGGTMAGVSQYLKEMKPSVATYLIDCPGSALANYFNTGTMQPDSPPAKTILQGVGLLRKTRLIEACKVDGAFKGQDREAVEMCQYLLRNEGLYVGPTAALNVCGAVKLARQLGRDKVVVTVLCDGGQQYGSSVYNAAWLAERGLTPTCTGTDLSFIQ